MSLNKSTNTARDLSVIHLPLPAELTKLEPLEASSSLSQNLLTVSYLPAYKALQVAHSYFALYGMEDLEEAHAFEALEQALLCAEEALTLLEKNRLPQHSAQYLEAMTLKADVLYCMEQDEAALESINQALALAPDSLEATLSKLAILDSLGRVREALMLALSCAEAVAQVPVESPSPCLLVTAFYEQAGALALRLKRYGLSQSFLYQAKAQLPLVCYAQVADTLVPGLQQAHRYGRSSQRALKSSGRLRQA